jgi:ParB-like chromosome segregation protein Spo0J
MERFGQREMRISSLRLPGDMRQRMTQPHIRDRADSIAQVGLIHPPMVRKSTREIIAGRDRIAAHLLLERESVTVDLVECTDEEAAVLEAHENIERRHDPVEQRRLTLELVQRFTEQLATENPEKPKKGRRGRTKTLQGQARELVAKERGVTPDAVRKAEERAAKRQGADRREGAAPDSSPAAAKPTIETWGLEPESDFLAGAAAQQRYIDDAAGKLQAAKTSLTQLGNSGLGYPNVKLQHIRKLLDEASTAIRQGRPVALCPWCKGTVDAKQACGGCGGSALMLKSQELGVPPELTDKADLRIVVGGRIVPMPGAEEPTPKRRRKAWDLD